jgi:hypothetical protein
MKEREAAGVALGGGELRPMDVCVDPLRNRWNKVVREVRHVKVERIEVRRGS